MSENINNELLYPSEKERAIRNERLCSDYERLVGENPTVPPHRIMHHLGEKYDLSLSGVRRILINANLVTPNN